MASPPVPVEQVPIEQVPVEQVVEQAPAKTKRAAALPPEERRSIIVAATLPLLLEHGDRVTTRQIAEAAGIAEGTIFRVFADKDELIVAVLEAALDPRRSKRARQRSRTTCASNRGVAAAVVIMQQRVIDIWRLMSSVGTRFHERARRPMVDSDALVRVVRAHTRTGSRVEPIGRGPAAPRATLVDDPPDARGRAAFARGAGAAVPARRRGDRRPPC